MKIKILTILLLLAFCNFSNAQTKKLVENITWELTDTKMTIYFDLLSPDGKERSYDLEVLIDLGDQEVKPKKGISGIFSQRAGKKRKITWYFSASGKTERELDIPELKVVINPKNPNPPLPKTPGSPGVTPQNAPSMTLPIVVAGVGIGTFAYGFILEQDASSLYDDYKANKINSASRDKQYDDADKKHIQAQYLAIGGGIIAAAGVFLISRTLNKRKAIKKNWSIIPSGNETPYYGSTIGIGIQYRF